MEVMFFFPHLDLWSSEKKQTVNMVAHVSDWVPKA